MKRRHPLFQLATWKRLAAGRIPGQVVIQYTDRCNAACAQCGMRRTSTFERSSMDTAQARRLLDAAAERGVRSVSFTGGEPLLHFDEIVELMEHAGRLGIPFVRTGTNGFIFRGHEKPGWEDRIKRMAGRLAATPLNTFWISVDSADAAVHERNRGFSGIMAGMEKALPIFHEAGIYPAANLGINRLTGGDGAHRLPDYAGPATDDPNSNDAARRFYAAARNAFRRFYRMAHDLGFTMANACYPMSFDDESEAVYAATSEDDFIRFRPAEKALLFRALSDTIPEFRGDLRIFSPRCSLLALVRSYASGEPQGAACRGGVDFFFVDCKDMNTYPCGYRGSENLGRFWDLDLAAMPAPDCRECDWECFRDPSEMLGPVMQALRSPVALGRSILRDKEAFRVWGEDVAYYRACGFFDGRKPPRYERMARYARTESLAETIAPSLS
ncbi:radical SAM protein [Oceanidesulfovibrio indonesiensis]|uniref:Radical SAM protein n=1 Tax=Oceanidesulfovibrio indonesiensis TaxID=54767 RepID=A0A7M3MGV5_9BACT|nr:radical SAM protein [Oceanidesulfovibrio indonesiensis]TVM18717.1 radical SAM protein [Oceanidesulfovibrio indonesiensis]